MVDCSLQMAQASNLSIALFVAGIRRCFHREPDSDWLTVMSLNQPVDEKRSTALWLTMHKSMMVAVVK